MRLMEAIVIILNLSILIIMFFKIKVRKVPYIFYMAIVLIIIICQMLFEGWRWQMAAAYLPVVFAVIKLLCDEYLNKRVKNRKCGFKFIILKVSLLIIYIVLSVIPVILMPVFKFDVPSGEYGIGTLTYHWVDNDREEYYTEASNDKRELMVQFWYPTDKNEKGSKAVYLKDIDAILDGMHNMLPIPAPALRQLSLVKTYAVSRANLCNKEKRYPLLIFSHGLTGFRNQNDFQLQELASQGYIVAAIDHTFDAAATVFPDGRAAKLKFENKSGFKAYEKQSTIWVKDVEFVLDKIEQLNSDASKEIFRQRIDLNNIGMLGHSFGGATSAQMLIYDDRIKAALNMDGAFYGKDIPESGLNKPFLLMNAENSTNYEIFEKSLSASMAVTGKSRDEYELFWQESMRRRSNALKGCAYSVAIKNTDHMSFTDFYLYSPILKGKKESPRIVHKIINDYSVNFFDKYLKHKTEISLDILSQKYKGYINTGR